IVQFLQRKWAKELDYRLIKELWAFHETRIAVRFAYEWHDDSGTWFRSSGNAVAMLCGYPEESKGRASFTKRSRSISFSSYTRCPAKSYPELSWRGGETRPRREPVDG
ncbi:MAG: DUF1348 family protein, partial [Gammaproteobacteria bacterium]